jgi:hypothetical protein
MPIDLSSFAFETWTGIPTFKKGTNVKIRHEIAPFWAGTYVDLRELEHPESAELLAFEQRAQGLFNAWDRHLPPKIYSMLSGAQAATISGNHPVTGASNFFSTSHYYNADHTEYGQFSNLIDDGGANASTPIYAVLAGGVFDMMKPWSILKGTNLERARAAGGVVSGGGGAPWVIQYQARDDRDLIDMNFQRRIGVYAERGYGLLFPHSILRFEGTLDYSGLASLADAARGMKDLNGFMPADQTRIAAFLCDTVAQAREINGILGREMTDSTAATGRKIDPMLQGAEVIVMSR